MAQAKEQWVVESLGESTATVEISAKEVATLPRALLPTGVREGEVLAVSREQSAERVTLTIERDAKATEMALAASKAQLAAAPVSQSKGDIAL